MTAMAIDWLESLGSGAALDGLKSLALLLIVLVLRAVLGQAVAKAPGLSVEDRRRWVVNLRNLLVITFVIGLVFIWAHELQTFAVSLVAIAVALVLATKELILCLSGMVVRVGANAYSVGDRIQIGAHRGIVLDQDWLSTTLLEIGPGAMSHLFTGRKVVFPNSLLLTSPLVNETYSRDFVFDVVTLPLKTTDDWQAAERALLEAAKAECEPYLEDARQYMKQLESRNLLEAPSVDPRITIQVPEPGRINLLLRVPMPARGRARVEQAVLRRFLAAFPLPGAETSGGG